MSLNLNVDLGLYRKNLAFIQGLMAPAQVMAVIKANAYGHSLVPVAKAAVESGIQILGVLDIETAHELRTAGVTATCFAWLHSLNSNFKWAIQNDVELSVSSLSELEAISAAGVAKVHLKIDTGLSRNGATLEQWPELVSRAMALQDAGSIKVLAVWSHLSVTSKTDDLKALAVFEKASQIASELGFNGIRHLASSPPAFNLPETRFDLVRIGVSAFGTSPIEGKTAEQVGLEIPMTATTTVVGGSEIGVGYLNGYPKNLAGKAIVKLTGKKFKVIAVNELTSTIETGDYLIGDEVVIFDSELTAEYLAEVSDTVTDEIFTALKPNSRTYS